MLCTLVVFEHTHALDFLKSLELLRRISLGAMSLNRLLADACHKLSFHPVVVQILTKLSKNVQ